MRLKNSQVVSDQTIASLVTTSTAICSTMANMEHPPRTSSRWPTPGIHMNLEFGVSFAHNDPPHTASMKYTSKNMQERVFYQQQEKSRQQKPQRLMPGTTQERTSQQQEGHSKQNPHRLMPGNMQERTYHQQQDRLSKQQNPQRPVPENTQERAYQQQEGHARQQTPQRLVAGNTQERLYQQHEGLYYRQHNSQRLVPGNTQERLYQQHEGLYRHNTQRLVPGNTQGRMYQQQEGLSRQQNTQRLMPGSTHGRPRPPQRHRSLEVMPTYGHDRGSSAPPTLQPVSPVSPMSPIAPLQHTSSMPIEGRDRPLPATPSHFRLGEDGLPWSTEPFYRCEEPVVGSPIRPAMVEIELEGRRIEDPQRVRELEELHQAMMTVDSLDHDGWVGDIPASRRPSTLGWAISTNPAEDDFSQDNLEPPPPPYVVSQWESTFGGPRIRPRSAFS